MRTKDFSGTDTTAGQPTTVGQPTSQAIDWRIVAVLVVVAAFILRTDFSALVPYFNSGKPAATQADSAVVMEQLPTENLARDCPKSSGAAGPAVVSWQSFNSCATNRQVVRVVAASSGCH